MSSAGFLRVESLSRGLKEVQQAKHNLEHRLNEKRQVRRQVESELDTATAKLNQVKDLNTKMQETMKIAQHKVTKTQAQSDSLEEKNKEKRDQLTRLSHQIKTEETSQEDDINKFQDELSKISKTMVEAKSLYTDPNLVETIADSKQTHQLREREYIEIHSKIENLTQRLQAIGELKGEDNSDVNRQLLWHLVEGDEKLYTSRSEEIQLELITQKNTFHNMRV